MYNKENLTKIKKMNELAPEVMKAFWALDKLAVAGLQLQESIPAFFHRLPIIVVGIAVR